MQLRQNCNSMSYVKDYEGLPSMVLDVHSRKTLGQQCCTGTMCKVVRRTDVRRFARDSAYPQVVSAWRRKTQCVCLVCVVVCMCNGNCATHGASRGIQHSQHDIRACEYLRPVGMLSIGFVRSLFVSFNFGVARVASQICSFVFLS